MASFRFPGLLAYALTFASTAFDAFSDTLYTLYTLGTYCVSALFGLWREVSTRVRNVLAEFSPMIHAQPGVQIVRASAHMVTFMHRTLDRRHASYLRMCA